jgi:hypothetical protein
MSMIIQFTGCGGTGKTTTKDLFLASEIGATFKTIPSSAREVSKEWGLETEDAQDRLNVGEFLLFQRAVTERFIADVNALVARGENVITERSMVDHMGYTTLKWARRSNTLDDLEEMAVLDFMDWMHDAAVAELRKVDILAFFPSGIFTPPADSFRTNRETERRAVDAIFRGLLWKFQQIIGGQSFPIATMSVEDPAVRGKHLIGLATRVQEELEQENFNSAAILPGGQSPAAS